MDNKEIQNQNIDLLSKLLETILGNLERIEDRLEKELEKSEKIVADIGDLHDKQDYLDKKNDSITRLIKDLKESQEKLQTDLSSIKNIKINGYSNLNEALVNIYDVTKVEREKKKAKEGLSLWFQTLKDNHFIIRLLLTKSGKFILIGFAIFLFYLFTTSLGIQLLSFWEIIKIYAKFGS